jgi:predicted nucleic acid-binding protein
MTSPIFIDANVPIYAAGTQHALREPSIRVMELVADNPQEFLTDAEVLQELLHRYLSSGRWRLGRVAFAAFAVAMTGRVEAMRPADVALAAQLADAHPHLSARDLVHLAVMRRVGSTRIVSADVGFDRVQGIERLDPGQVVEWQQSIASEG